MDPCIFISHSHRDRSVAEAICATLESRGQRCWMARRDILPGSDWIDGILDAIRHSQLLILVYTPAADQSPEVRDEYECARKQGLPIIVFRIVDFEASERVRHRLGLYHWLDASDAPAEQRMAQLCAAVMNALDKRRRERSPAPRPDSRQPAGAAGQRWQLHVGDTAFQREHGTSEPLPPPPRTRSRDDASAAMRDRLVRRPWVLASVLVAALAALAWLRLGTDQDAAEPVPSAPRARSSPVPPPVRSADVTPDVASDDRRVIAAAPPEATVSTERRAASPLPAQERVALPPRVSDGGPEAVAAAVADTLDPAASLRLLESTAFLDLLRDADPLPDEVFSESWRATAVPANSGAEGYRHSLEHAQQALAEQGWPAAVEQFNAAADAAQTSLRESPDNTVLRTDTAALLRLAGAYSAATLGMLDHAAAQLATAATVAEKLGARVPHASTVLCLIRREQALLARQQGNKPRAAQLLVDAAALVEGLPFRSEIAAGANACLLQVKKTVASWAVDDDRLDRAATVLGEADGLVRLVAGTGTGSAWLDRQKLDLYRLRGRLTVARGDDASAIATFDEAANFAQGLLDQAPESTSLRIAFIDTVREAVRCRAKRPDHDGEALSLLITRAMPAASELLNARAASRGAVELDAARLLRRLSRPGDAAQALERARAIADARLGLGGLEPGYNRLALAVYAEMARVALSNGDRPAAFAALDRASAIGDALEKQNLDDAFIVAARAAVDGARQHIAAAAEPR